MRTREILSAAKRDGARAGRNAASWCIDGNTTDETLRRLVQGLEDGDPMILDAYRTPNLSGEFADDPTPRTLQADYDVSDKRWDDIGDGVCNAWQDAADEAFRHALEATARRRLED